MASLALLQPTHARILPVKVTQKVPAAAHGGSAAVKNSNKNNTSSEITHMSVLHSFGGPSPDCTAVFKGGASDPIETGMDIGLGVLSIIPIPGFGPMAKWMGKALDFLKPPSLISAKSVYDCISGFVEEAIDNKIDAYDLQSNINYKLGYITQSMEKFTNLAKAAPKPVPTSYQVQIALSFNGIREQCDSLGDYFTTTNNGVRDPAGALPAFATFVSTQWLPIISLQYSNYQEIFGTDNDTSAIRQQIALESGKVLKTSEDFYNRTFTGMIAKRLEKVKQSEYYEEDHCVGPIAQPGCSISGYKFKDETTGYEFKTWRDDGLRPERGGEPERYINEMRRCARFSGYLSMFN